MMTGIHVTGEVSGMQKAGVRPGEGKDVDEI